MQWLTYEAALTFGRELAGDCRPQVISLIADSGKLAGVLPTYPHVVPPTEGVPCAMRRWYARLDGRIITVECVADSHIETSSVLIHTRFTERQDTLGDWAVLLDLQVLPNVIYVSRPLYIESRIPKPDCVVYRPDSHGWNMPVYNAASRNDADRLLEYMYKDIWNRRCFIGEPEPLGTWATVQDEQVIRGTGSQLHEALRFACDVSLKNPKQVLVVRDISGLNANNMYFVSHGHVLDSFSSAGSEDE